MRACICTFILNLLLYKSGFSQAYYPQNFMPNGPVERLIQSNDTLFGVGNFYMGGYRLGSFISYDGTQRDELDINTPYIDAGTVSEAIPDGNGGWYVAGQSISYNGNSYRGVLHIRADKTVNPNFLLTQDQSYSGWVKALYLHEGILYVGGSFQNFPGFDRSQLIAYNTISNQFVQEFNAGFTFNNQEFVNTIAVKGNELMIGGSFTNQPANRLARINRQTGTLIHDFNANGEVNQLFLDADTLYVGGNFTSIAGNTQQGMAKIKLSDNTLMNCANFQGFAGLVNDFKIAGPHLYVGGRFSTVNGQNKPSLAKINRYSAALDNDFNVIFDLDQINALAIQGDQLLIGGIFNQVNGEARKNLAQVDRNTGALNTWNSSIEGTVEKMFIYNGNPYILGGMDQMNREIRNSFFALKLPERTIIPMNYSAAGFGNSYRAIAKQGNLLFFGSSMANATINGTPVSHLFALNMQSGEVQSIGSLGGLANPYVDRLLVHDGKLYVGGYFTQVNGQSRNRICAFNLSDYSLADWTPEVGGSTTINKMEVLNNKLYICGSIERANPFGQYVIAALSLTDGSWQGGFLREPAPGQNFTGNDFLFLNNSIYLAGNHIRNVSPFLQAAVIKMSDFFVIDPQFNGATPMNSLGGENITQINGVIVVMQRVNTAIERYLYFHHPLTGDTLSKLGIVIKGFQPFVENTGKPYSYVFDNNMLYIGGNWDRVNGNAVSGLAIIDGREDNWPDLNPTSLDEIPMHQATEWFIYPNPTSGLMQFHNPFKTPARLDVIDLSGRVCHSEEIQPNLSMVTVHLNRLHDGVYFLVLHGKDGMKTGKVAVRR